MNMSKLAVAVLLCGASVVAADTTIYFEDGSSITTDKDVYLSNEMLFTATGNRLTELTFKPAEPTTSGFVGPVPPVVEPPLEVPVEITEFVHGVAASCATYVYPGPATFTDLNNKKLWDKDCDGDGDGDYDFCKDYPFYPSNGFNWIDWEFNVACKRDD